MISPLNALVALPQGDKVARGLLYTPAEIAQQPATWLQTWQTFKRDFKELKTFLRHAHEEGRTIFLIGAGSSDYIGYAIATLMLQNWGCEVIVAPSTDLLTNRENMLIPGHKYLWISFSRSGDSPESVAVLEQAIADCDNVMHLVVSCNSNGQMVRLANGSPNAFAVVLDEKVNDRSLAMTSSFTNMVVFGQLLATIWKDEPFETILEPMTQAANYLLEDGAFLAEELCRNLPERACFVGIGSLMATARESALKLVELTGGNVQTMAETTLGLRHGPMSALNSATILISFVSTNARRQRYDLDLQAEILAKRATGRLVSVGTSRSVADHLLFCKAFESVPDAYRAPVDVIFGQLFGLFASISSDLMPDSPSPSGLISRVVQKFAIH